MAFVVVLLTRGRCGRKMKDLPLRRHLSRLDPLPSLPRRRIRRHPHRPSQVLSAVISSYSSALLADSLRVK